MIRRLLAQGLRRRWRSTPDRRPVTASAGQARALPPRGHVGDPGSRWSIARDGPSASLSSLALLSRTIAATSSGVRISSLRRSSIHGACSVLPSPHPEGVRLPCRPTVSADRRRCAQSRHVQTPPIRLPRMHSGLGGRERATSRSGSHGPRKASISREHLAHRLSHVRGTRSQIPPACPPTAGSPARP